VNFGVVDARGREIGCRYVIEEIEYPHPDGARVQFSFSPRAMRDGADYGAIPVRSSMVAPTLAGARRYAEIYVEGARRRAHKAHGAKGGV
jgi:hypothetical protein